MAKWCYLNAQRWEEMGKLNDAQLQHRIEHILERHPNASSLVVRQRLMSNLKPSHIYPLLVPFYEQYRIDDSADIQRDLKKWCRCT